MLLKAEKKLIKACRAIKGKKESKRIKTKEVIFSMLSGNLMTRQRKKGSLMWHALRQVIETDSSIGIYNIGHYS